MRVCAELKMYACVNYMNYWNVIRKQLSLTATHLRVSYSVCQLFCFYLKKQLY
jgi:tRNA uridine 5-carbamoylmethylation protein Kti12